MKMILEIETISDAVTAQRVIEAYKADGEPKEGTPKVETPKRKTRKKVEAPKEEVAPEVEAPKEVETKEEAPKEEAPKEEATPELEAISIKDLTDIAKAAVAKTDRATVKSVISEFGEKLSSVNEEDYNALAEKLKAL